MWSVWEIILLILVPLAVGALLGMVLAHLTLRR